MFIIRNDEAIHIIHYQDPETKPAMNLKSLVTTIAASTVLALLLGAPASPLRADDSEEKSAKPAKLFESSDTLTVNITSQWQDLERNEKYQGPYPATLKYTNDNGEQVELPLTVERRGVKRQETCDFPPIKLRFEKEDVKGTMFRGQKSLKMVTHCDRATRYQQYYMIEMLTYRMYNLITDYSFRVRELSVTYTDSENGRTDDGRFAFLIEDDCDVAKRLDLKKLKIPNIGPSRLEKSLTSEFVLFQYMIGNVDWAALSGPDPEECCHNVKLIAPSPYEKGDIVFPIPYDFDSSGIVNAPYAAPPAGLPIRRVTQRLYRGYCVHNETMPAAREKFLANEAAIMDVLNQPVGLNSSTRKRAEKYLKEFFETIRDDKDWNKQIMTKCRK